MPKRIRISSRPSSTAPGRSARSGPTRITTSSTSCAPMERRGDEVGARLHAADSIRYLVEALAALEGLRPRFHDRLAGTLGDWEPRFLEILRSPDVETQLARYDDVHKL